MTTEPSDELRETFLAELHANAEVAKGLPFVPEEYIDGLVAYHTAVFDVLRRGLEAMAVDEAEALLRGDR